MPVANDNSIEGSVAFVVFRSTLVESRCCGTGHSVRGKAQDGNCTAGTTGERIVRKALAMKAFLKSDLFLRFLGGFAVGAVAMFVLQPEEPPMFSSTAVAATSTHGAAL
jgi:hypothetical protein